MDKCIKEAEVNKNGRKPPNCIYCHQAKETDLVQEKKERTFNDIVTKFKEHINTRQLGSRKGMTEDELN